MQMYTFVCFSVAILETPSKKTAVILSHLYVIGLKIVLRDIVFPLHVHVYVRTYVRDPVRFRFRFLRSRF